MHMGSCEFKNINQPGLSNTPPYLVKFEECKALTATLQGS